MLDYSLSTHPVWKVLDEWGLPDELINIIFNMNRPFSPINHTINEYNTLIGNHQYIIDNKQFCYNNVFITLQELIFKNINRINHKLIHGFIKEYNHRYYLSGKDILVLFGQYYNQIYNSYSISMRWKLYTKINFVNYESIPTFHLSLIYQSFKHLLTLKFSSRVIGIQKSHPNDYFELDSLDYDKNRFDIRCLWKNIRFISLLRSEKCINEYAKCQFIPKHELLMFNFILALPYKKSWVREKLIRNIYTNEPPEENGIISYFDDTPDLYTLENLSIVMKNNPFSSVNKNRNEIDIHETLNAYSSHYNKQF